MREIFGPEAKTVQEVVEAGGKMQKLLWDKAAKDLDEAYRCFK